jgi:glutathione S-transferase
MTALPVVTTLGWVPKFARGFVRDQRVRWAFEEVGRPYAVRLLDFREIKTPAHRALQPFGQVPTLSEDGLELFESGAIILHIARSAPGLLPDDTAGRARAEQWVVAALNSVEPAVGDLGMCDLFEADCPWSAARRPAVVKRLNARLSALADHLGGHTCLDGEHFTAGDLVMTSALRGIGDPAILDEHPVVRDYVARHEARPAFQRAMRDHLATFEDHQPEEAAA